MQNVIERARRYVAKCPPAVSGQGGHNSTFHVAAVLVHGFALGEADALALLGEWNRSCLPPWSESDLRHKITSAANTVHLLPRVICSATMRNAASRVQRSRCRRRRRNRNSNRKL